MKEEKAKEQSIFGYALVDGVKQKIGNYMVELPGLFRGRGKHPKTGRIKVIFIILFYLNDFLI